RQKKHPPAQPSQPVRPGDHRKCSRSSSLATVLPCQRPPRGVATFRLVSSSAIFSIGRWPPPPIATVAQQTWRASDGGSEGTALADPKARVGFPAEVCEPE